MPTVADLERLSALIRRLTPLTNVQRGEVIRAQDWNNLVDAIIEVAEIVVASEEGETIPSHTHLDQVKLSWLDSNLRTLIEQGPLGDPAAETRVAGLERLIKALAAKSDNFVADIGEVRNRITEIATRDLIREAAITALERKVEGFSDGRDDVLALRRTLDTIRNGIDTVLEISSRFEVDGAIVDMAEIVDKLERLIELRERLTTPSGELFDATALEIRLTNLTNTLVTEEELNTALDARLGDFTPDMLEGIEDILRTNLIAHINTIIDTKAQELQDQITTRFSEIDGIVAQAIADELPAFKESLLAELRPEIATAVQESKQEIQDLFDQKLEDCKNELRDEFTQQISTLNDSLPAIILSVFEEHLPTHLDPIREQLTNLDERLLLLTGRVEQLEGTIEQLNQRVEQLEGAIGQVNQRVEQLEGTIGQVDQRVLQFKEAATEAREELKKVLLEEMNRRDKSLREDMDKRFAEADQTTQSRIEEAIASARQDLLKVVMEEFKRLAGQIPSLIRKELPTLQPLIADMINKTIAEIRPGLVDEIVAKVLEIIDSRGGGSDSTPSVENDFTRINGIGPVFARRLVDADIKTFAQLAALKPQQIGEILGISADRVISSKIIEQARKLARGA